MRIIFAGTPEFARVALAHLQATNFEICAVLSQPDRPAGRGMKLQASPVKAFALENNIPVLQPRSLRLDGKYAEDAQVAQQALMQAQADIMIVAAYGLILPQWVLDMPRYGCLNIHASLLPRWRGAAPIHRAIEAGDAQTGITIMQMDAGLDTGAMLLREAIPIQASDTTGSLHDRLAALGANLTRQALDQVAAGTLNPVPQPSEAQAMNGISYAHKIDKSEALVRWDDSAVAIERRIRAFNPAPGASTCLGQDMCKLWEAQVVPSQRDNTQASVQPGTILALEPAGIDVQCGASQVLRITTLQRAGAKKLPAAEFLRGASWQLGMVLGS